MVAKASTIVAVKCRCRRRYRLKYNANVNYPLLSFVYKFGRVAHQYS